MADITAISEYLAARKQGRKYLSEHSSDRFGGHPIVLETLLDSYEQAGEIYLGTHEIPLRKIVGTYTDIRSDSFSGNFLPLLEEGTEFSMKWQSLYQHHIRDGITDPIKVYEFLGMFYVIEGNKRVSVMNWVGAYSIRADITRILPKYDENSEEIRIYYEILGCYPRSFSFYDMWFSKEGRFSWLMERAKEFADENPDISEVDLEKWLPRAYRDFSLQYERAGFRDIPITTGDAFCEYVRIYGIPHQLSLSELAVNVRACEAQFRLSAGQGGGVTIEQDMIPSRKFGTGILGLGVRRARVLYAYRTTPATSSWTRSHESGRLRAESAFDGRITSFSVYDIDPDDPYHQLIQAIDEYKPDILFTVNSLFAAASLRIGLERPDLIVFNCNHSFPQLKLNTYFTKLYEQTFVLGAVAAAYTKTDTIGFIDLPERATDSTYGINAFAQGALLINHNISITRFKPEINFSAKEDKRARRILAENGADVVLCQYPNYGDIVMKPFDDLYAMLCSIRPNGAVAEYLAGAAWNWETVYSKILGGYLADGFEPYKRLKMPGALYFWLGMSSGAAPIYKVDSALGTHTSRLCDMFCQMVGRSKLHPFTGPIRDAAGVLRVGRYDTPSLSDIQSMDWLCDIIVTK